MGKLAEMEFIDSGASARYCCCCCCGCWWCTPLNCSHKHGRCSNWGCGMGWRRRRSKWWSMNYLLRGSPASGRTRYMCLDEPNQIPVSPFSNYAERELSR